MKFAKIMLVGFLLTMLLTVGIFADTYGPGVWIQKGYDTEAFEHQTGPLSGTAILGVFPSVTTNPAVFMQNIAGDLYMLENAYYDGSAWQGNITGKKSLSIVMDATNGAFKWNYAAAGTTPSFAQVMGLSSAGALTVGASVDRIAAGTLSLGTTTANAISIGGTGVTTTNNGAFTSTQTLTATGALVANGDVDLGNAATDTISLTGVVDTDVTGIKEVNRSITVATSTTAATVGANIALKAATGAATANGGNAYVLGGAPGAGGIDGTVNIGTSQTSQVELAASTVDTSVNGSLTVDEGTALNGNVDLGNAAGDTVSIAGTIDTDIALAKEANRDFGINASTTAATVGANLTIHAGDGTPGAANNGGNLVMRAGNSGAGGVDGEVQIGTSNTSALQIGATGILTTMPGSLTVTQTLTGTLTGNADTATAATNVGITDDTTTNATMYPVWVTANTGNLPAKVTSTKLSFNPNTGALSSTTFTGNLTGDVTGNVSGSSGSCTGNAATATTATDATNAANIAITDDTTTNATFYPAFVGATTGNNASKVASSKLTFNPSTGALAATTFTGNLTGDVTGNVSGSSGTCTGNAGTVTNGLYSNANVAFLKEVNRDVGIAASDTAATVGADITFHAGDGTPGAANNGGHTTVNGGNAGVGGTDGEVRLGAANTSAVVITPDTTIGNNMAVAATTGKVNSDGGFDRKTAGALALGGVTATSCTITPATDVVGNLSVNTTKMTVNATTGNVAIAGDVDVTGSVFSRKYNRTFDFDEGANLLAASSMQYYFTLGGTAGTAAIVADENGAMELDTTATGSRSATLTYTPANFNTNNAPDMTSALRVSDITNSKVEVGWYVDGNDCLMFRFDTAVDANNIYLISENNNGGEQSTDTTVDLTAGATFTFRIKINADETFAAYINGAQVAAGHVGTIRQLGTFKPWFYIDNKAAAEQKLMDIDYLYLNQAR